MLMRPSRESQWIKPEGAGQQAIWREDLAPPVARQTGRPIAAFRAQGRLSQLSARSGLYVEDKRPRGGWNLLVIADETEKWGKVIRAANIKPD
jgi:hypothetical protein